jgi:hypothetical protein
LTPSIGIAILSLPKYEGGIKLLDLKARNKAIQATWLLKLDRNRPLWAYIADEIISTQLSVKSLDKLTQINIFLQAWRVNPNANSKLPQDPMLMLQIGHELNVDFKVLSPMRMLKEELLTWYQIEKNNALIELTNKTELKCLHHHHQIKNVLEMNDIAMNEDDQHCLRRNCKCIMCQRIRAETRILTNVSKWQRKSCPHSPQSGTPISPPHTQSHLYLTPTRKTRNKQAEENGGSILFDPNITT